MNVLMIKADDLGSEQFECYGVGGAGTYGYAATPTITSLATNGVKFTRFYAQQLCSPDRYSSLTGRHPGRGGVIDIIRDITPPQVPMPLDEFTIAHALKAAGYATGVFGKWHLANSLNGGGLHPSLAGFDYAAVSLYNLDQTDSVTLEGVELSEGYSSWLNYVQGVPRVQRSYQPSQCVTDCARWIKDQRGPWFAYVPLYSTHVPFTRNASVSPARDNTPPVALYDSTTWSGALTATTTTDAQYMHCERAGVEAMDTEIARLLASVDLAETLVIFDCDNGTDNSVLAFEQHPTLGAYPATHAKNTPYEPAICVPLIIAGAGVVSPNRSSSGLVSCVDIMPTVLEMCGVDVPTGLDGISFADVLTNTGSSTRTECYSEWGQPLGCLVKANRTMSEWAIVGPVYKIVHNGLSATNEFYKLDTDPFEASNLTPGGSLSGLSGAQRTEYDRLIAAEQALAL